MIFSGLFESNKTKAIKAQTAAIKENTEALLKNDLANQKVSKSSAFMQRTLSTLKKIGIASVITAITYGIYQLATAQSDFNEKASSISANLNEDSNSISNYKTQIEDLYKIINSSTSSIEETTSAREELMSIQDQLVEKFGIEKDTINIVTEAIKGQVSALDELQRKQYYQAKNEYNTRNVGQQISDFISYGSLDNDKISSNMDKMIRDMESSFVKISTTGNQELDKLISESLDLNILSDMYGDGKYFSIYGSMTEIQEKLTEIQNLASGIELSTEFENDFTNAYNDVSNFLDINKALYDQYILFEKILNNEPNNNYDEYFNELDNIKEKYDEAFKNEEVDNIDKFSNDYAETLNKVINEATENNDFGVAEYFKNLYPELKEEVSKWTFEANFNTNTDGLKDQINNAISKLKNGSSDVLVSEDILNGNYYALNEEQKKGWTELNNLANEYGLTIENLIALLEQLGIINSERYQMLVDKYGLNNVKGLSSEDLSAAYKVDNDTITSWEELRKAIIATKNIALTSSPDLTISDSVSQIAQQLRPQFDELAEMYQNIFTNEGFTLEDVDNSMLEGLLTTLSEIESEIGVTFDRSKLNSFFSALSSGEATAEQVQQGFNDIATSILYSTDVLNNLNNTTAESVEMQLKQMGITNSEELVTEALAAKNEELAVSKIYLAETGENLANVADDEAAAFIIEQIEAGNCGEALAILQLKKMLVNGTLLDTTADIDNVLALAQAAGLTSDALTKLASVKSFWDTAMKSGDARAVSEANRAMREISAQVQEDVANFTPVPVEFDGNTASSAKDAEKAGKEAADKYLEAFEKEYENLNDLLDHGKISEKEYLDQLRKLYQRYFKDKEKYLKEYAKYEDEYLRGMKSLYEDAFSYIGDILDDQIDAYGDQKDAAVDSLEAQRDAAIEAYEAQKEAIEEQIEAAERQKEELQDQIDTKQDEIDAINEAADARQREIDMQKAQYELQRMMSQRTQFIYKDGQMVYEADTSGIRDAKEEVADLEREQQIADIEKEIDLLEKQQDEIDDYIDQLQARQDEIDELIDSTNEYYDELIAQTENYWDGLIQGLEDYKSRWDELADLEEQAKMQMVLEQLGVSTEEILSMSDSAFQNFKNNYLAILSDIYAGNDQMLASIGNMANVDMSGITGYLEQTQAYIDSLNQIDLTTANEAIAATGDAFKQTAESVGLATNAIVGGGAETEESGGGEGESQSSENSGGGVSFKQAIDEGTADGVEKIGEISNAFAGDEDGENGTSVTGSIDKVITKVGTPGGEEGGSGGEGEGEDSLTGALQEHIEYATGEEGIPAEQLKFEELKEVVDGLKESLEEIQTILEELSSNTYEIKVDVQGGGGLLSLPGHAKGAKKLKEDELAWTQEKGSEIIVSPTRQAILTPLEKGDSVINDKLTENLFKWGEIDPNKFMPKQNYSVDLKNIPINVKTETSKVPSVSIENVSFTCPGVTGEQVMRQIEGSFKGLFLNAYQQAFTKK